jgi:hypothetical protein
MNHQTDATKIAEPSSANILPAENLPGANFDGLFRRPRDPRR